MNQQLTEIISLLLGMTGLLSFVGGIFFWFKSNVEKRYAAERDFAHIRGDYKSLQEYVKLVGDDVESVDKTLIEIKATLINLSQRIEMIAIKLSDGTTGGFPRQ